MSWNPHVPQAGVDLHFLDANRHLGHVASIPLHPSTQTHFHHISGLLLGAQTGDVMRVYKQTPDAQLHLHRMYRLQNPYTVAHRPAATHSYNSTAQTFEATVQHGANFHIYSEGLLRRRNVLGRSFGSAVDEGVLGLD